jgi:hypothetical protein
MALQIQLRRDTAANWTSVNPTLAQGEVGAETDTGKLKVGNGSAAWNSLSYSPNSFTVSQISDLTASAAELNVLDGITATTAELNVLDGITATTAELNHTDGVTSNIQTQLNDKAPLTPAVDAKTSAYTLVVGDRGKVLTANGTFSITVPASVFSAGDRVDIVNIGTGDITLAAGAGMTLNSKDDNTKIDGQYSAATILFQTATAGFRIGALKE